MSNHVSQPTAQALRGAGWEWETEFAYMDNNGWLPVEGKIKCWHPTRTWLWRPSIGELRERLKDRDFRKYFSQSAVGRRWNKDRDTYLYELSIWLLEVTASADALAEVWLWKEKEVKP
jgi:hypothetical protein